MKHIMIIDDEEPFTRLCKMNLELSDAYHITIVNDPLNAMHMISEVKPDLIFLDVQMPGLTGFEVARQLLARGVESRIVFVTALDQYAIEAFEVNAVDYLLKPVDAARLEQALGRARRRLGVERGGRPGQGPARAHRQDDGQ